MQCLENEDLGKFGCAVANLLKTRRFGTIGGLPKLRQINASIGESGRFKVCLPMHRYWRIDRIARLTALPRNGSKSFRRRKRWRVKPHNQDPSQSDIRRDFVSRRLRFVLTLQIDSAVQKELSFDNLPQRKSHCGWYFGCTQTAGMRYVIPAKHNISERRKASWRTQK